MGEALIHQLALVSESNSIPFSEVAKVSAALQKQVMRDLAPLWNVQATVDGFERLEDVPLGYWPMIIRDNIGFNAAGIHLDNDGQPFALISSGTGWSLTASHECLEMLVDPFGNRVVAGDSPMPNQGRVEFLVEVCDPSEAAQFGYTVNGIMVSDFYTNHFFDPIAADGVRYSFTGAITEPRQVLRGGYLSWHDPISNHWFQETWFGGAAPQFRDIGLLDASNGSLRSQIDRITTKDSVASMQVDSMLADDVGRHGLLSAAIAPATTSKAAAIHAKIDEILQHANGQADAAADAMDAPRRATPRPRRRSR